MNPALTCGESRCQTQDHKLHPAGSPDAHQLLSPGERLRQSGSRCGQARSAALFQLATDLPAAVLARLLGIHITVAVAWQRASAGDWAITPQEISKRHQRKET